jgi:hypothetical protein
MPLALFATIGSASAQSMARLDLSNDPEVDSVNPKLRMIFENLGGRVPGPDIMNARDISDLETNWRPTYHSLGEFVASVQREGWKVAAKRDLSDFYVAVLLTTHGNLAAVYYAKDRAGLQAQQKGAVRLFVSDNHLRQIVPDEDRYDLVQRWKFSAISSSNDAAQGLMPGSDNDLRAPQVAMRDAQTGANNGYSMSTIHGWLVYREGLYFVMPAKIRQYLVVFIGGDAPSDRIALSLASQG